MGHTVKFMVYCCVSMHLGAYTTFPATGLKAAENCTASKGQQHWLMCATEETKKLVKETNYGNNPDAVATWEASQEVCMKDEPFGEKLFLV